MTSRPLRRSRALGLAVALSLTGGLIAAAPTAAFAQPATVQNAQQSFAKPSIVGELGIGNWLRLNYEAPSDWDTEVRVEWLRGGGPIPGESDDYYLLTDSDVRDYRGISARVTYRDRDGSTQTVTSDALALNKFASVPTPSIQGTPDVGQFLYVDEYGWNPYPESTVYQWFRDGAAIPGATTTYYFPQSADAGKKLTVSITGSTPGYVSENRVSAPVTIFSGFSSTPTPTVSGVAQVGKTLTAATGNWSPTPDSLSYQWKRGGAAIAGATARTYVAVAADTGKSITVTVTASRWNYPALQRTSTAVTVVAATPLRPLTASPTPTIAGTPTNGSTLTANSAAWGPAPVTLKYQWKRDGANISGATAKTYKLTSADAGKRISVALTGSRTDYVSATKTSSAIAVGRLLGAAPTPGISGTPTKGSKLTAKPGTWSPAPVKLAYQWKRNGANIAKATGSTYTVTAADHGKSITVVVTGTKAGFQSAVRTSGAVQAGAKFTAKATPKITGNAKTGALLTSNAGSWSIGGLSVSYQWRANGTNIAGATGKTYRVNSADNGKFISVVLTAKRAGFMNVSSTSGNTAKVSIGAAVSGDNTWLVGKEIAAGTYVTTGSPELCYWERRSGFSSSMNDLIANDLAAGQMIVTIKASDRAFKSSRCGSWTLLQNKPLAKSTTISGDGQFSVQRQIVPGLYRSSGRVSGYGCYWERQSDFLGEYNIIDNDHTYDDRSIVRISASDAGFVSQRCGTWTRIGN